MVARIIAGERVLEARELEEGIAQAAAALASSGVVAGGAVALLLRNDFAFFVASLAAHRIGAFATPINWHATADEIGYVLNDCEAKVLIGHDDLLAPLDLSPAVRVVAVPTPPEIADAYGLPPLSVPRNATTWAEWLGVDATVRAVSASSSGTNAMIYTSGTTGRPKGVRRKPLREDQIAGQQLMAKCGYGLSPEKRMTVLMTGPMYHSAPNSYGLIAAAIAETIILQPRFDAKQTLSTIACHAVTHIHMVPTMFVRLLKLSDEERAIHDLSSLEFVVHGAAPCPVDVKRRMIEWWGPVINEYYGSTETGLTASHGSQDAMRKPGTVGRALPGATLMVIDDHGEPCQPGEIGDVYVWSGAMPDFTYHGLQDERAAIGRDGLVTVGDIGWLDEEGFLFLCDRRKDMIISGGVNIYPAEIEAELLAMNGVRDCAVFGIPDAEFGEQVCAFIELEPGRKLSPIEVKEFLGQKLSRFKIPRVIKFAAELPREDSGKIFKRRLREPYWANAGRSITAAQKDRLLR